MPIIKRYPNRKLYDTEAKRYVTLDGIAKLIRDGQEVQVIDYTTDEDLTAVTLTQIIFEQEKKKGGFLPKSVLTGLVQAGGDTMNTLRRTLSSPLELLRHVDEEIEERLQTLVERGELAREEAVRMSEKLIGRNFRQPELPGRDTVERILGRQGVPSRAEVQQLSQQIDALATKIDNMIESGEKEVDA